MVYLNVKVPNDYIIAKKGKKEKHEHESDRLTLVKNIMIIRLIVAAVIVVKILACFFRKPPEPL